MLVLLQASILPCQLENQQDIYHAAQNSLGPMGTEPLNQNAGNLRLGSGLGDPSRTSYPKPFKTKGTSVWDRGWETLAERRIPYP